METKKKLLAKKNNIRKMLWICFLGVFVFHLAFRIFLYRDSFTKRLDGEYWRGQYEKSQWVVANSKYPIGDDGLYAYHGWVLVRGGDPSLINPEVPPFGKYLIGLIMLIFGNNNIFGLLATIFALSAFFLFNTLFFKDKLLAFIPVFLFSFEPLLYGQLRGSYLDTLHLGMLFLIFYFFIKRYYILMGIVLGFFAAVKFSTLFVLVVITLGMYKILKKQFDDFEYFVLSLGIAPVILLLTYTKFFLNGNTIIDFLKLQKYIYVFYAIGAKTPLVGMIFPMIFLNKWHTWWDGVIPMNEWSIGWVSSFIGFLLSFIWVRKLMHTDLLLQVLWILLYLAFLLVIPVYPRYLLLLLPFIYNVTVWVLLQSILKEFWPRFSSA